MASNPKAGPATAAERAAATQKRLELAIKDTKVFRTTDTPEAHPVISSGTLALDVALGGGYGKGRIVEVFGPASSGKTTLALQAIAAAQRGGGIALFVDAEHALDLSYGSKLGVKTDELLLMQPDTGEDCLDAVNVAAEGMQFGDVVVVDSVAALIPKAELDGDIGDAHVGLQARLMSQALRKIVLTCSKTGAVVIFINQVRAIIGGMSFGPKTTTTGGEALRFYASHRIDIRRIGGIKDTEKGTPADEAASVGNRVEAKVVKNKLAPPFRSAEMSIYFGEGVSKAEEILDLGITAGIIVKEGSYFLMGGERIAHGRANAIKYLKEKPALLDDIEPEIRDRYLAK